MFENFVGQDAIVKELKAISSGLQRNDNGINILLRGSAGCGKTTLAKYFCYEVSGRSFSYQIANKEILMTPNIVKLRSHIVDEVHMVNNFESFYSYMDLGKYIFVFCTTEAGNLPDPFSSRCITLNFQEYSIEELTTILVSYSKELGFIVDKATAELVSKMSRGSPRIAKKYLQRIKFLLDKGYGQKTIPGITTVFEDIGIFKGGYTDLDVRYLRFLSNQESASLQTISRSLGVDTDTIKNEIEPFLLEKGHITISNRGRSFISWKNEELKEL